MTSASGKPRRRSVAGIVRPLAGDARVAADTASYVLGGFPDGMLPLFVFTPAEAARVLSISVHAVHRDIARGNLRARKVEGHWKIELTDLVAYGSTRYRHMLTGILICLATGTAAPPAGATISRRRPVPSPAPPPAPAGANRT